MQKLVCAMTNKVAHAVQVVLTVWCSEIGSLTSLDACNSGACNDVREPVSLHQGVLCGSFRKAQRRPQMKPFVVAEL